jgi:hypothetical protein
MNISGDRITRFTSSQHRFNILYDCRPCFFQTNSNARFVNHKLSFRCSQSHGDWFVKCKKKGYKNYYHIIHKYYWDKIMMNIRK